MRGESSKASLCPLVTPPASLGSSRQWECILAVERQKVFEGKAKCATCHVPPLFTEPGNNLHSPAEIGIDDFLSRRSPTQAYRTTPLRGVWSRTKGGFYHDGRFPTLNEVALRFGGWIELVEGS